MDLFELIDKVKEDHNKEDFYKAIDEIRELINTEIGKTPDPYDILFASKDTYNNKILEQFVDSDTGFKDLIDWNITDLESFSKVVDLVKALKELQIRRSSVNFFDTNISKVFYEVLLECMGTEQLETSDELYLKYAELIPYMYLTRYVVMFDRENSYNLIKNYFDNLDRDEFFSWEYEISIDKNDKILDFLSEEKELFQRREIKRTMGYFIFDEEADDRIYFQHNGVLKHFFDNELFNLLDENNRDFFLSSLRIMREKDFEPPKDEQSKFFFSQLKASIIDKISEIKEDLSKENFDDGKILDSIGKLSNQLFFNRILGNDYLVIELNNAFLELKEKRSRHL